MLADTLAAHDLFEHKIMFDGKFAKGNDSCHRFFLAFILAFVFKVDNRKNCKIKAVQLRHDNTCLIRTAKYYGRNCQ